MNFTSVQAQQLAAAVKPGTVVVLQPTSFADEWPGRPKSAVAVGLRRLSAKAEADIEVVAHKRALEAIPADARDRAEELYWRELQESRLGICVARALCDPNDAAKPLDLFAAPDIEVFRALTAPTMELLYQALEREVVGTSPIYREATDEEVAELARLLAEEDPLDGVPQPFEARIRRFVAFMLDDLDAQVS